jgi:hypothetical protein
MAEHSSLATAADIFAAPNEAFETIKSRPTALLPIVVLVLSYSAVSMAYMHSVDLPWFMEQQIAGAPAEMSAAEREQAIRAASAISPTTLGAIGSVTSSIFILICIFLMALYFTGVSFATNDGIKLKQWFSLTCWCTLPVALGILASLVNILAGDARFMAQEEINPLALGNLFGIEMESPSVVQRILFGLDLTSMWALVLMVLGYQAWTRRSILAAVAIVLGPLAAIVLITTLVAML